MAYIYKITNNVNGKFYIGKTKRSSLVRRWKEHQWKALDENYRHPLYDGIRHHGLENFSIEVLEECDIDLLDEREKFWIAELRPIYNLTIGGNGGDTFTHKPEHMKEDTRKRISMAVKKRAQNPEYIRKLSDAGKKLAQDPEYIARLSDIGTRLAQNPDYLQRVSAGVKRAITSKKGIWSECKKGRKNGRWLGILEMYYPSGELYKSYESAVECKKDTGLVAHYIRTKARTGQPIQRGIYLGYTFRFNKETE